MPPIAKMALASRDKSSLGNLLIREGLLDQAQLNELMVEFNDLKVEVLLGQFLVRKGVLPSEKLELLLIRQEAERNGGVETYHVKRAMALAQETSLKVVKGAEDLVSSAQMAMAARATEAK